MGKTVIAVRTSDRGTFKRCRRKWAFSSGLKMNRGPAQKENFFWIGTVGHYAMEDYHGYNRYGHPVEAAKACYDAFKQFHHKSKHEQIPDDHAEQMEMLYGILDHYVLWLKNRDTLQTFWYQDEPQVEVKARIPLPIPQEYLDAWNIEEVFYEVTLDRITYDEYNRYWVLDYKFLKQFQTMHLDYDQQASAYIWAANCIYPNVEIEGFMIQQYRKAVPVPPGRTSKGIITTDMKSVQGSTTHELYKLALRDMYGSTRKAPPQHRRVLGELADMETEDRNNFIRRDKTIRSTEHIQSVGSNILMEVIDMINPDLPLYPNPTKDCYWDCSFRDICLMIDREEHWQDVLEETTIDRNEDTESWRNYLP